VVLDKSTDTSVNQNMVVYVRFVEEILGRTEPVTFKNALRVRQLGVALMVHQ